MKRIITALVLLASLSMTMILTACAPLGEAENTYAQQMQSTEILSVSISVDPAQWEAMLASGEEKYISADITINGERLENVGIRPKGNSSRMGIAQSEGEKRYSFKIKFDKYVEGQTWKGLDKLNLNNNYADASAMKEYLSYDIMRYIGVETPLYCYADIAVNEETWGFYLAIEDYEESYLTRAQQGEGVLYKPESADFGGDAMIQRPEDAFELPEDWDGELPEMRFDMPKDWDGEMPEMHFEMHEDWDGEMPEDWGGERGAVGFAFGVGGSSDGVSLMYSDDEISSYSAIFDNAKTQADETDYLRVIEALKHLSDGTELEDYIDVDATLRYLAAHTAVVNLDSYSGAMAHNYVLYERDGTLCMLPWDYNMAFGGFMNGDASSSVNFPIDTPVSGVNEEERPMIQKLLEVPEYLARYRGYLQEIVDGYFANGAFEAAVDALDARIGSYIQADPTAFYTYEEYQAALVELKKFGTLRAQSIAGQLDGSIPTTMQGQTEQPEELIDASEVDMSALGSMGSGRAEFVIRDDRVPPEIE